MSPDDRLLESTCVQLLSKKMGIVEPNRTPDSLLYIGKTYIYNVYGCTHLVDKHVEAYQGKLAT